MTMLFHSPPGLTTLRYPIKLVLVGVSAGRRMRFPAPQLGGWGARFHQVVSRRRAGSGVARPTLSRHPTLRAPLLRIRRKERAPTPGMRRTSTGGGDGEGEAATARRRPRRRGDAL